VPRRREDRSVMVEPFGCRARAGTVYGTGVRYLEVGKWKLASLAWLVRGHRAVTTLARV